MNTDILYFLGTEEIPYFGIESRTRQRSAYPRIFRRTLDIIGYSDQPNVYKEIQTAPASLSHQLCRYL